MAQCEKQPALTVLRQQARTVAGVARMLGIPEYELRNVLHGRYRPTPEIREQLPVILQTPLSALFVSELLTPSPYPPRRRKRLEPVA